MPKRKKIPKHGRKASQVAKDYGTHAYSADVPIGNTDPTVVYGKLYGGMPNRSRAARGGLYRQAGRYT